MTDVEELITKTTVNWDGQTDMIVSPKFNYQDGWWNLTDGKWIEEDKPADNRCFLDLQCDSTHCCSSFPDTNNRRCILIAEHNVSVTKGPVTFTPSCASKVKSDDGDEPADPDSAQKDQDSQALADASEALNTWHDSLKKDAQEAAGYDSMTAEE